MTPNPDFLEPIKVSDVLNKIVGHNPLPQSQFIDLGFKEIDMLQTNVAVADYLAKKNPRKARLYREAAIQIHNTRSAVKLFVDVYGKPTYISNEHGLPFCDGPLEGAEILDKEGKPSVRPKTKLSPRYFIKKKNTK